jgi:hypothetical protein
VRLRVRDAPFTKIDGRLLLGVFSILTTATDIFPAIRIPIVAVIWRYTGLLPDEMANRSAELRTYRADHCQ